jgi:choline kinase
MDEKPTLLVLAAGMGSRYGGLKQLDPMGPARETLLDYSVFDAIRAGFGRIVFVIRREIESPFRETIGKRYEGRVELDYAFQELDDLPDGYQLPEERTKPWGTGHAILAARSVVRGNFAVINADDFYGADAYAVMASHFKKIAGSDNQPMCMVGYSLDHTLSRHGSVNRGLCQTVDARLQAVEEVIDIERDREGTILGTDSQGKEVQLQPDATVSMNFWGFSDAVFEALERHFVHFLKYNSTALTAEFYIPTFIDDMITREGAQVDILPTKATWFGVTYPGDKPFVQQHLMELTAAGDYPSPLQKAGK